MTKGIFFCDGCGDHGDDDDGLIVHELDENGFTKMTCMVCAKPIKTEDDLVCAGINLYDKEKYNEC